MTTKETVWLIVQAILDGNQSDIDIIAHSGNKLSIGDIDKLYICAENIIFKARSKPEKKPEGQQLVKACRSWLDYYEWD